MSHETLIAQLARDVAPVTPLPSPAVRAARWILLAVLTVVAGVVFRGLRANWAVAAGDPVFVITTGLILAMGIVSAVLAMTLSVPGVMSPVWMRRTPGVLLAMWGGVLLFEIAAAGASITGDRSGVACVWKTYGIAVGPAVLLTWLAHRAAPLDWRTTGSLAALAALSFGVLGTEIICPITGHGHLFTWHFLPVAGMTAMAFVAAAIAARR